MSKEPYKHKENNGSMFPNDRKEKETHADLTGSINVGGQEYWLNGWQKDGGRISVSVKPKQQYQGKPGVRGDYQGQEQSVAADDDGDVPF